MESQPSTGHLRSSTTGIAFFGTFEFCFEFNLEFLPRLTGLFERDRLLSFSDSDGSDALPGLKMAGIEENRLFLGNRDQKDTRYEPVKCFDFLVFDDRVNLRTTGFSLSVSELP